MTIKNLTLFALLATFALVVSSTEHGKVQTEESHLASGLQASSSGQEQGGNLRSILDWDFKAIANQVREAITQAGRGAENSQIGQSLSSMLEKIASQLEDKREELKDPYSLVPLVNAINQDYLTIVKLVSGAARKASQTESGAKFGKNLHEFLDLINDAGNILQDPQLKDAMTEGFYQILTQTQKVLDDVAQTPAGHQLLSNLAELRSVGKRGLSQLLDQMESGDLEKNVQSFLDGFSNYAEGAGVQLNNLETVKLAKQAVRSRQGEVASKGTQTGQASGQEN